MAILYIVPSSSDLSATTNKDTMYPMPQVDALQHVATEGARARDDFQSRGPRAESAHPGAPLRPGAVQMWMLC